MGRVLFFFFSFMQIVKRFPALFESRKSTTAFTSYIPFPILSYISQVYAPSDFLNTHFHIIIPSTLSFCNWTLSLSKTLCEPLVSHIHSTRAILLHDLILLYLMKNTDHECFHFAASCSLLLLHTSYAQIPNSLSYSQTPSALKKEQN
jgi:hypothetical protein